MFTAVGVGTLVSFIVLGAVHFVTTASCTAAHNCDQIMCAPCRVATLAPSAGLGLVVLGAIGALVLRRVPPAARRGAFVFVTALAVVGGVVLATSWS